VTPEQQPFGQFVALQLLHTPPEQTPSAQGWQAWPPTPQASSALPGRHVFPEQHPFGHEVPSHTQRPLRQRWLGPQDAPSPHAQLPSAAQPSALDGSQATQDAPATPQVASVRGLQAPSAQQPSGHEVASQPGTGSIWHVGEQPSPGRVLPSSHVSIGARTTPSPQMAGAPRVSVTLTIAPWISATACCWLATTVAPARPSTRRSTVEPPSSDGRTMLAVSAPVVRGRGGSGSVPGENAGIPAAVVPEMASAVRLPVGS
jgi:hypothetical protein